MVMTFEQYATARTLLNPPVPLKSDQTMQGQFFQYTKVCSFLFKDKPSKHGITSILENGEPKLIVGSPLENHPN